MHEKPARVFVSCGQREGEERQIAHAVKRMLDGLGYEAYLAVYEQTLLSLRENIFAKLGDQTEYFLFVDLCREKIDASGNCRGSLFSHQELAIASFLGFDDDVIIFQEKGLIERDGMIYAFQANATSFSDRSGLVDLIKKRVENQWRKDWQRKLVLDQADDPDCEAVPQQGGATGFFFHIRVKNRHIRATARNCYAYLRSVRDALTDDSHSFEAAELRWAGYHFPSAIIPPGNCTRRFDAVWFNSASPGDPRFKIFSDWPRNIPRLRSPGAYVLEYEVVSDNVPGSILPLRLDLGPANSVRFGKSQPVEVTQLLDAQTDHFNSTRTTAC
jgi:hypothetical protein